MYQDFADFRRGRYQLRVAEHRLLSGDRGFNQGSNSTLEAIRFVHTSPAGFMTGSSRRGPTFTELLFEPIARSKAAYTLVVISPTVSQLYRLFAKSRICCRRPAKSVYNSLEKYSSIVFARSTGSSGLNINPVCPWTISFFNEPTSATRVGRPKLYPRNKTPL